MSLDSIQKQSHFWPTRIGYGVLHIFTSLRVFSYILGITIITAGRKLFGGDKVYYRNILHSIRLYGLHRWFSTSLISFTVAVVATGVGGVQLKLRGLQSYVISLLAISMTRSIVPIVVSLFILGGASRILALNANHLLKQPGAKYRAIHLYHMPQLASVILTTPLLYLYALMAALLGNLLVSVRLLNLLPMQVYLSLQNTLGFHDVVIGLCKTVICGITISILQTGYLLMMLEKQHEVSYYTIHFLVTGFLWIIGITIIVEMLFMAGGL